MGSLTNEFANREIYKKDKEMQTLLKTFQSKNYMHVCIPWDMFFYQYFYELIIDHQLSIIVHFKLVTDFISSKIK